MNCVSVVIVNWNSANQLNDCLKSLESYFNSGDVVVVDNNSVDGSQNCVSNFKNARLIQLTSNAGFATACNVGANASKSKFLLFLNPDASVFAETIKSTVNFMSSVDSADVGICGVKLIAGDGHVCRSCTRFPSALSFCATSIGLNLAFPCMGHFMAEWGHDETKQVAHVIGAYYFVRRALFNDLNGFDERFFVYLEDLDFSYRAKRLGWRTIYLANVQAFHAGGGTSNQVKARRLFYSLRSRLIYSFKNFNIFSACVVLFMTLFIEPLSRSVLALARKSLTTLQETWMGYGMLWIWLPQWIFKGKTR